MSAPPAIPKVSEASFQRAVIEYAERFGWLTAHFHDSRRQVTRKSGERLWIGDKAAAGFPDLVAVKDARIVFAELKARKGRLSSAQDRWLDALALSVAGAEVYVWRPGDWPVIETVLGRAVA